MKGFALHRTWFLLTVGGSVIALAVAACIGDDPGSSGESPDAGSDATDASTGNDPDTGAPDTGAPVTDGGADSGVACQSFAPVIFASVPFRGPFCNGAPGNHCAFGEHCCRDLAANTQVCAASCPGNVIDIACFNPSECNDGGVTGLKCCGSGTPRKDLCPYTVLEGWTKSRCAPSCASSEFQQCETNPECDSGTCTPMRALTPDNKQTTNGQMGACL